jgi:DNA-binding SARP family transcriptional activator
MSTIEIRLFGKLGVCCDERPLAGFDAGKVRDLLSYLLLYRDRPHRREALATLLWGSIPAAQSKKYLRQALWQLQAGLEAQREPAAGQVLLVEPEWVHFNPGVELWLDVAIFEQVFARFEGTPGQQLNARECQTLQEAVQLYGGDLLEECYEDWCVYERTRFQTMYLAMLDKLMGYCEAHREYEAGISYGAQILRYDRASERTHRRLMRLYYLLDDRTAALRQYERCVAALAEELDVRPARQTVALHDQIRADQLVPPAHAPVERRPQPPEHAVPSSSLPDLLGRLKQLQGVLNDAQRQVQQGIQAVEQTLHGRH